MRWDSDGMLASPGTGVVVVALDGTVVTPTADDPSVDDLRRSGTFDPLDSPDGPDPLLSPDGQRQATCLADVGYVIGPADGSTHDRLLRSTACNYSLAAWSPDGKDILMLSDGGRNVAVSLVPASGGVRASGTFVGSVPINGARSFPGRGDVSWQPIDPGTTGAD